MASIKGTIKRLVSDKGFGFIAAGDGNEYFFHQSACSGMAFDDLREGQAVTLFDHLTPRQVSGTFGASHAPLRTASQLLRAVPSVCLYGATRQLLHLTEVCS